VVRKLHRYGFILALRQAGDVTLRLLRGNVTQEQADPLGLQAYVIQPKGRQLVSPGQRPGIPIHPTIISPQRA